MRELTKLRLTYAVIGLLIGILLGFLIVKFAGTSSSTENNIKIGFIGPLTGENANIGQPIQRGVELALKDINEEWKATGKSVEVVYEDGKCNGKDATTAIQKLIDQDKVNAIVGGVCSSETLAMAPVAEAAKLVIISPSSTNPSITTAGDYVFRVVGSDALQGKIMAEYVFDEGYKKAAMIYQNSDYNVGLKNVFTETFTKRGGEIVAAEAYEADAKDFRTQLTKIKAAQPEATYIIPYSEGGLITKQIRELGMETPLFGPETFESKAILEDGGDAVEGLIFTKPKFDPSNPASAQVIEKYKQKYNSDPEFQAYVTNAYDAVMLIVDALEKGKDLKTYLYDIKDYPGAGGMLTIDSNGDAIKDFQLMIVKNGKFEKYES